MSLYAQNTIVKEDIQMIVDTNDIPWDRLKEKTVAVTGATGLIGRTMVWALLEANKKYNLGLQILAFVRNEAKAQDMYTGVDKTGLTFVCQDILKPVPKDIKADFLIHGASITASKMMVEQPVETITTAIDGTRNMMEFAAGCQMEGVVYLSSMEAYGIVPDGCGEVREADLGYIDPLNIRSSYSEGKRMVECLCASYASEYGVPVKIARLAATFGAGIDPWENRVFAQFARSVIAGEDIVLHTKGEKANCYCYTVDAITGILLLLLKGEVGQAYNVCNMDTFCSIKEMADTFVRVGNCSSKLVFDIPEDLASLGYAPTSIMKLNSEKIMQLGWRPRVDMPTMADRLMQSIRVDEEGR